MNTTSQRLICRRYFSRCLLASVVMWCANLAGAAEKGSLSGTVTMLAASSTTDVIEDLRKQFVAENPGVTLKLSFEASSVAAQRSAAGASADLFLSASSDWVDMLTRKDLIERQVDLLGNQLVIITRADSKLKISREADLANSEVRKIALADPQSVPVGVYARQALTRVKLWDSLESKIAGAANVRQSLQFVDTGAAEAGIVYATDAAAFQNVRVVAKIDPALSEPIRYPLALIRSKAPNAAAVAWYEYLQSPAAAKVFTGAGFECLTSKPTAEGKK